MTLLRWRTRQEDIWFSALRTAGGRTSNQLELRMDSQGNDAHLKDGHRYGSRERCCGCLLSDSPILIMSPGEAASASPE
jgi:hypothetical protein